MATMAGEYLTREEGDGKLTSKQAAATSAITGAGLVLGTVTQQSSGTVPLGSVISQNPAAGASVAAGSAVNLVVSSGPAPVPVLVPNVVNQAQATATTAITWDPSTTVLESHCTDQPSDPLASVPTRVPSTENSTRPARRRSSIIRGS